MAKYDVYQNPNGIGYFLDVQTNFMKGFDTCVVVPLINLDLAPKTAQRLNPIFSVDGERVSMVTQFISTVPKSVLKTPVANLKNEFDKITHALDMVFQGF